VFDKIKSKSLKRKYTMVEASKDASRKRGR